MPLEGDTIRPQIIVSFSEVAVVTKFVSFKETLVSCK